LLYGATGNGKTTIARHIAKLYNIPFIEIKSEEVIDSHLGTTSGNIYKIFDGIKEPCVLFWDEVDSVGGKRGGTAKNSAEHENDRMTNSILVNLDRLSPDVMFIAATNRVDVLDSAFIRRFDVKFEIPPPSNEEKEMFFNSIIEHHRIPVSMPDLSKVNSMAEIKDLVMQLARTYISNNISNSK
jgi:SpoVK/Ycf46/Vps4 family AAA+-type ATPase